MKIDATKHFIKDIKQLKKNDPAVFKAVQKRSKPSSENPSSQNNSNDTTISTKPEFESTAWLTPSNEMSCYY